MKYEKPKLIKILGALPPVTVNFAQPASQIGEKNYIKVAKKV
ncbi:MAG: hypothetical protein ACD_19C00219G0003 [uncultured bacterium]|nr:MAG: hypothetical protein ACD_19C00219G0003 [uncultured bacterium]